MNREIRIDVHTLQHVKLIASGNPLYITGSCLELCDDLDGWDGEWEEGPGRRV